MGSFNLNDEVNCAHIDPEFKTAGRDHSRNPSRLEVVLNECALFLLRIRGGRGR